MEIMLHIEKEFGDRESRYLFSSYGGM